MECREALQYVTEEYSTCQYITVQYSSVQYSAVQYSSVQYSILQYSGVQGGSHLPCTRPSSLGVEEAPQLKRRSRRGLDWFSAAPLSAADSAL